MRTELEKTKDSLRWYQSRIKLLAKAQKFMRDPERTLVCDIIANCGLLPDPKRYGFDPKDLTRG